MFDWFRRLAPTASAEDIRAALDKADIAVAQRNLDDAHQQRTVILLEGDDVAILKAEAAIDAARIQVDRVTAIRAELANRLARAEIAAREKSLIDGHAAADKALADIKRKLIKDGAEAAKKIDALLTAVEETDRLYHQNYQLRTENQGVFRAVDELPPLLRVRDWLDRDEARDLPETLAHLINRRIQY
ncbi:hypothetical protein J2Y63_005398 [Shinella sp. BE166]|uniref:hypothetical protein n=1 Tax=Shinella sp. BE166 TaxID=3373918 RepID=UPI003EBC7259